MTDVKDKKIILGCFRNLAEGEARLLIMRHGAHKNNVLAEQALRQATATGVALASSGLKINNCVSSPSPRAVRTMLAVQEGYGTMNYIRTEPLLSDLAYGYSDEIPALKAYMASLDMGWNEPNIAKAIFDRKSEHFKLGLKLAVEAAEGLIETAVIGQTTLYTTHGVGRIEPGILMLRGGVNELRIPDRLIEMGQIVEVILDAKNNIVEENWLEPITVPAA